MRTKSYDRITESEPYGAGPPAGLPSVEVQRESGNATLTSPGGPHDTFVPGPIAPQRPGPQDVRPIQPGEPTDYIFADRLIEQLQLLSDRVADLSKPQPQPWEYRGPTTALARLDPLAGFSTATFPTIPPGEVWEIEYISAQNQQSITELVCYENLASAQNFIIAFQDLTSPVGLGLKLSPPIRLGGGSRLVVEVYGVAEDQPVRAQYRMFRIPKGGKVPPSGFETRSEPRMP